MTNREKINTTTNEELAELFIWYYEYQDYVDSCWYSNVTGKTYYTGEDAEQDTIEWLESEVDEDSQNRGKTYIYKCGVDEFTGNYESMFDAKYDSKECTMIEYDIDRSLVLFANGEKEVVETEYLVEIIC